MTRDQLEHAIRAACEVADDTELIVFGSQAILGEYPQAPKSVRASVEVDVQPKNRPEAVDKIDGALGELSPFHELYGFYVQGVPIEAATLPEGWQKRTISVRTDATKGNTGYCLESHDLAASKLFAFREKDREFVTNLLKEGLVDSKTLCTRIAMLPAKEKQKERLQRWLAKTIKELD